MGNGSGGAGGIVVTSENGNDPQINGLNIYNNTIVAKAGDAPTTGINFSNQENGNATNVNIRNNIVIGFTYAWLSGSVPNTAMSNVVVTHNDAFGNGSGNAPDWPSGNPVNYTYNNNLSVDPLFISSTDFRLRPNSPVIDRGIDIGLPYYGNAPDMGYSEFNPGGPVPIKLVDLTVRENAGKNILQWTTATESNSSHFNVERSADGQNWFTIGVVNASGFTTTETRYGYTDANPLKGMNYYRLAMIDKDNRSEYSKIVSISSAYANNIDITFTYLSLTTNTATLKISSTKTQTAGLSIIDISGRTILNTQVNLQEGNNNITKNVTGLLPAIYYVRLYTNERTVVKKVLSRN